MTANGARPDASQSSQNSTTSKEPSSVEGMNGSERHTSPSTTSSPPSHKQAASSQSNERNSTKAPKPNTTSPPTNGAGVSSLNPRSCVTCRKRKVRCDKRHPCINCNKAGIECVFPGPGRAPRRSRKPPDTELLARLRRLEGVVKHMGRDPEEDIKSADNASGADDLANKDPGNDHSQFFDHLKQRDNQGADNLVKDFGRLVVEEGRSRYVANRFWTALSEEVRKLFYNLSFLHPPISISPVLYRIFSGQFFQCISMQ